MVGETISGVLGLFGTGVEAANQRRMQERAHQYNMEETEHAAGLNYMYNEMAANNADERARAQFNDLYSPEARVQQLKNAELSVGLMYGTSGTIGQGQAQGAQGAGAAGQQGKANAGAVNSLGIAQILSNIRLNESIANKNNAEAESTRGEEGTVGGAQVQNYQADTENKKALAKLTAANEALARAQTRAQEINNEMSTEAFDFKLQQIEYEMLTQAEELQSLILSNEIKEASKDTQIEQYRANLQETYAEALYKRSGAAVNRQQAGKIIAEIQKIWAETDYMKELPDLKREQISAMLTNAGVSAEAAIDSSLIGSVGNIVASFGRFLKIGKGRSFGQWMQKRPATVTATQWYN